ncbi:hypothetical protein Dda_6845 [Drechslerella dactyloides]|uniref:Uncharacterized protein n=1 Tax=Drechslerella dactyloides TaxID=74499 RepID=A0AAD6NGJ6_DREDA|nr:hypothetical protein Dda_6845 [Drechslerella dactyloides]
MNPTPPPRVKVKKPITSQVFRLLVLLVTLPYHRFFLYNTLRPTEIIERFAPHGTEDGSPQREKICDLLKNWRARKKGELEFISIAVCIYSGFHFRELHADLMPNLKGVAVTAIVTATLSWGTIEACHWIGIFFFYASLITSIIGMLLAAQQTTLLTLLGEFPEDWREVKTKFIEGYIHQLLTEDKFKKHHDPEGNHVHRDGDGCYRLRGWRVSWQMIFVWQIPMMAVGYSFLFYIIGLTVLIITPLIKEPWGDNSKVSGFGELLAGQPARLLTRRSLDCGGLPCDIWIIVGNIHLLLTLGISQRIARQR